MDTTGLKTFVFTPEYLLDGIRYHCKPWTIIHQSELSHLSPEMDFVFQRERRSISLWLSLVAVRGPDLKGYSQKNWMGVYRPFPKSLPYV